MTKRSETVAEREWHEFKADLQGRPAESLDLLDVERSIQEHLSAMGRELMVATMKKADTNASEVDIDVWLRRSRARAAKTSGWTRLGSVFVVRHGTSCMSCRPLPG